MTRPPSLLSAVIAGCCALCATFASHAEPLAYPASMWGQLVYPAGLSQEEKDNTLLSGRFEQGADWFRFGDEKWKFNTYVALGYSMDTKELAYNNKLTPAVGVKVSRSFESGMVDLGLQLIHERRWKEPRDNSNTGVQVYASWWFGWDSRRMVNR